MIGKITSQYGSDAVVKSKAKKGYGADNGSNEADEASFSLFAVKLARISSELKSAPDVRQDLVDDFKKKVEAGEYHPPLEKIAQSLLLAGILKNVE